MATATATAPAITREVLEDRYDGAFYADGQGRLTETGNALNDALFEIAREVMRAPETDDLDGIVDELWVIVRQELLDRIDARGLAS